MFWIPGFGFLALDSLVWIPAFGFLGLDFWVLISWSGFLVLDSCVWIPWFTFLIFDSLVWIPGFGFLALDSRHPNPTLCHRVHSWVWIPGFGVLGLDSWLWSPEIGVLGLDSWIRTLGLNPLQDVIKAMIWSQDLRFMSRDLRSNGLPRGNLAREPISFYKPFVSWRAHCALHFSGRVDWKRFL